jgi:hypothetical protein
VEGGREYPPHFSYELVQVQGGGKPGFEVSEIYKLAYAFEIERKLYGWLDN